MQQEACDPQLIAHVKAYTGADLELPLKLEVETMKQEVLQGWEGNNHHGNANHVFFRHLPEMA